MTTEMAAAGSHDRDLEWLSLDDDETIVWAGSPDRRTLVPAFVIGIPLSIVLIGLFIIVGESLRVRNTDYVVTDAAVYRKTGVLSRDVKRIDHQKVQDIAYSQSALGATFGYGTVELTTAGGSGVEMAFRDVSDPRTVQQRISEQLKRHRDTDEDGPDDVLDEILEELRAIRAAVEASDSATPKPSGSPTRPEAEAVDERSPVDLGLEEREDGTANPEAEPARERTRTRADDDARE